jgi:hypothetical protein
MLPILDIFLKVRPPNEKKKLKKIKKFGLFFFCLGGINKILVRSQLFSQITQKMATPKTISETYQRGYFLKQILIFGSKKIICFPQKMFTLKNFYEKFYEKAPKSVLFIFEKSMQRFRKYMVRKIVVLRSTNTLVFDCKFETSPSI